MQAQSPDSPDTEAPAVSRSPLTPRVLVVLEDHEERVALCAELRERGCDPVCAPDLSIALRHPPLEPGKGIVRLILMDQKACAGAPPIETERLLARHPLAARWLLASAWTPERADPPWQRVLRRPLRIEELVKEVVQGLKSRRPGSRERSGRLGSRD